MCLPLMHRTHRVHVYAATSHSSTSLAVVLRQVVVVMRENIEKAVARGEGLEEVEKNAQLLLTVCQRRFSPWCQLILEHELASDQAK